MSSGNPSLKPEKSQSFTAGIVLTPIRAITLTADFWQTRIKNVIIGATANQDIIDQYYKNNGVVNVPGYTVRPAVADQQNLTALPLLGTVATTYKNADQFLARGLDFSALIRVQLTPGIKWTSNASASMLLRLEQTNQDGSVNRYDNSLGPCNITSCSGAPKWRGSWQNTLDFNGRGNVSLTGYYTSGYMAEATDTNGVYGDCKASAANGQVKTFPNGDPIQCHSKRVLYFDGHAEAKIQDRLTVYMDVKNLLNTKPAYEPNSTYGIYQFNPAWSDALFIGRFFRVGAKVDF